ncbi:MAG: endolytic transglycosylase MltG [Candidatus Nealsonbacteria bacterium]|nr:endolytic transglycosylase MltG [Candidatus Nealsonbacteria bacterium]
MGRVKKYLYLLLVILVAFYFWQGIYLPKVFFGETKEAYFDVKKGEGVKEIAQNLEEEGIIKSVNIFRVYVVSAGVSGKLQAGKYSFGPKMSIFEIVHKLAIGDVVKEKITIIEGWNLRDIAGYLEERNLFKAEEFLEAASSSEGFLFPDTYEINIGKGAGELVNKAISNFDKKVTSGLSKEVKSQRKSIFEIVSMASMLEKEVKKLEDKKIVSGILWKRINNYIPLQVDATITYITGKKTTKISKEETQIDSPYNTYRHLGLPPGPISNPGIDSILAAIYPEKSEYWYYLSTQEGETIFSKTLEEHNIAKAKYLK